MAKAWSTRSWSTFNQMFGVEHIHPIQRLISGGLEARLSSRFTHCINHNSDVCYLLPDVVATLVENGHCFTTTSNKRTGTTFAQGLASEPTVRKIDLRQFIQMTRRLRELIEENEYSRSISHVHFKTTSINTTSMGVGASARTGRAFVELVPS